MIGYRLYSGAAQPSGLLHDDLADEVLISEYSLHNFAKMVDVIFADLDENAPAR
jgi:hypothetical protein